MAGGPKWPYPSTRLAPGMRVKPVTTRVGRDLGYRPFMSMPAGQAKPSQ
jgi:hypothetical protein